MTMWDQITDDERERLVVSLVGALPQSGIPEHLRAGLVRYFSDGIMPGSFMQAVLCNDLTEAVVRAGPGAVFALTPLIVFLREYAPTIAWGSRAAVLAWSTTPERLEV